MLSQNQIFAIATTEGKLLKVFNKSTDSNTGVDTLFGFHPFFGFLSNQAFLQRLNRRKKNGLTNQVQWSPLFSLNFSKEKPELIKNEKNLKLNALSEKKWELLSPFGNLLITAGNEANTFLNQSSIVSNRLTDVKDSNQKESIKSFMIAALLLLMLFLIPKPKVENAFEVLPEPLKVMVKLEKQKIVTVAPSNTMNKILNSAKIENKALQSAVKQNLGFLGVLGKKDLKNALGGIPVSAKNVTAGAGAGGNAGSGGEFLTGLGEGVKKGTVGNTGVAGLGGIGTKGAGGGAGGYGNTLVGSGTGKSLSKMSLSNDMVLEGGLDRAVIQATISKYLSEVRACYESELQKIPGLSGLVSMNFNIDAGGNVSSANVAKSSLGNPQAEGCITKRLMNWKFPKPVGGVVVKVNYPFLLRPAN